MTMKAFIFSLTTKKALQAPMNAPTRMAMASDTGSTIQSAWQLDAEPDPGRGEEDAGHHRGERHDALDREVHVAGDDDERQADRHGADEGRLLDDVCEDPELQIARHEQGEDGQHDEEDEPDEIVEHGLDGLAPVDGGHRWSNSVSDGAVTAFVGLAGR